MAPFLTDHHPSARRWPALRAAAAGLTLLLTTAAAPAGAALAAPSHNAHHPVSHRS
jgi:hypothetical protein